jgi:hypothetical protein
VATRQFPDVIAAEITRTGAFSEVLRNEQSDECTLVIRGAITRYQKGSAAARFWVGMGAGTSHFDAIVEFRDGSTDNLLGTVVVDKNSWVLGGGLASGQTPEVFMQEAARKIARELQQARTRHAKQ